MSKSGLSLTPKFKFGILTLDFILIAILIATVFTWRTGDDWSVLFLSPSYWLQIFTPLVLNYLLGTYDIDSVRFKSIFVGLIVSSILSVILFTLINFLFYKDRSGLYGRGVLLGSFFLFSLISNFLRYFFWKRFQVVRSKSMILFLVSEKDHEKLQSDLNKRKLHIQHEVQTEINFEVIDKLKRPGMTLVIGIDTDEFPNEIQKQLFELKLIGLRILELSEFYEITWANIPVYHLELRWFLQSDGFSIVADQLRSRIKRLFDVVLSIVLIVFLWPVILIAALAIKLESQGPVFYHQIRTGRGGQKFRISKLRSMRSDAEKNGAQWAQKNDSRITRVGKFLRKTRIDELPQLLNVLRGQMSFIGPRPERPEFIVELEKQIPFYQMRHMVRPGLTGWAQVCYPYGASIEDAKEKLQYEIYYIKHHTLWLDLLIILRTVKIVLRMGGT
ncbi:MAG: exopolysaccharide biosynthesis polyprenyl glycosylphosphotransferase [Bdellovibrionales bacterium]